MALGKFNRPATTASAPAGAKKKSRYAGIAAAQPRDPMPHVGVYRFRVLECVEGCNPGTNVESFKTTLEIVDLEEPNEHHKRGQRVTMVQLISGPSSVFGLPRTKSFVMAAAGYADEGEYDAFDPDGGFIDSCVGASNEYAKRGDTIVGRLVDCLVSRGNATPAGDDYYREFTWQPVDDAEQTAAA